MAKNKDSEGLTVIITAGSDIKSGDLVIVENMATVALVDIANGQTGAAALRGVWEIPAATAAIAQGKRVYWDAAGDPVGGTPGSGAATATESGNTIIGVATEAKAGGGATVKVKLNVSPADDNVAAANASIADAGGFFTGTDAEAVLQEVGQHIHSTQKTISVPLGAITEEDGTVLTKQATTVAGLAQLADKEQVVLIPLNCTQGENLAFAAPVPQDLDDSADVKIHVLAGKDADNDVLTLDCEVYPVAAGDAANADIQDTAAQTIIQAVSELIFTCGADGVLAAPGVLTVVLALGGTNDGDKVYVYAAWIEYTGKALTS